jgi:hypothetical protein
MMRRPLTPDGVETPSVSSPTAVTSQRYESHSSMPAEKRLFFGTRAKRTSALVFDRQAELYLRKTDRYCRFYHGAHERIRCPA